MLHHLSLGVRDLDIAGRFYDAALAALGYRRVFEDETAIGYGVADDEDALCLKLRDDAAAPGPGFHLAFAAATAAAVDAFHAAAIANGGADNGAPGPWYSPSRRGTRSFRSCPTLRYYPPGASERGPASTNPDKDKRMDVAARRNRTLFRWIMVTLLAVLMPFAALAQPAAGQADGADAATAADEAQCRACTYERIGPKVDIGLVALVSLLVVGLLIAASREWGTTSQRWTCRTLALLLVGIGLALLWWAGSVVYLGYNPWQEMAAPVDGSLTSTLLTTSPKWLAALVLIGFAPSIWKRSERLPAWRIG